MIPPAMWYLLVIQCMVFAYVWKRFFKHKAPALGKTPLRKLKVAVCSSGCRQSVEGLMELLATWQDLVADVEFVELPYSGLDSFRFNRGFDVMILAHSIHNRRFSITNVMDALYDKFLPMARGVVAREKMCIVVHDFDDIGEPDRSTRMDSFRARQPLAFECAQHVFTCGKLGGKVEIAPDDEANLQKFLLETSRLPSGWDMLSFSMYIAPWMIQAATSIALFGPNVAIRLMKGLWGGVVKMTTNPTVGTNLKGLLQRWDLLSFSTYMLHQFRDQVIDFVQWMIHAATSFALFWPNVAIRLMKWVWGGVVNVMTYPSSVRTKSKNLLQGRDPLSFSVYMLSTFFPWMIHAFISIALLGPNIALRLMKSVWGGRGVAVKEMNN